MSTWTVYTAKTIIEIPIGIHDVDVYAHTWFQGSQQYVRIEVSVAAASAEEARAKSVAVAQAIHPTDATQA